MSKEVHKKEPKSSSPAQNRNLLGLAPSLCGLIKLSV